MGDPGRGLRQEFAAQIARVRQPRWDALQGADAAVGLPTDPDEQGALAPRNNATLSTALVRVSLDDEPRDKVRPQQ